MPTVIAINFLRHCRAGGNPLPATPNSLYNAYQQFANLLPTAVDKDPDNCCKTSVYHLDRSSLDLACG